MAEINNYTMNIACDMTCLRQVSLRRDKPLARRVAAGVNDCCGPKFIGACCG